MNQILFLNAESSSEEWVKREINSFHEFPPAIQSGVVDRLYSEETLREIVTNILDNVRSEFDGVHELSVIFRAAREKLDFDVGVSTSTHSYSLHVVDYVAEKIYELHTNSSADEQDTQASSTALFSPDLVQITETPSEVQKWIDSFVRGRREAINKQNLRDFLVPEEERQNCARIDTKIVKRAKSHVKVERKDNTWGPKMGIRLDGKVSTMKGVSELHVPKVDEAPADFESSSQKKVFSSEDIAEKLTTLKSRTKTDPS